MKFCCERRYLCDVPTGRGQKKIQHGALSDVTYERVCMDGATKKRVVDRFERRRRRRLGLGFYEWRASFANDEAGCGWTNDEEGLKTLQTHGCWGCWR